MKSSERTPSFDPPLFLHHRERSSKPAARETALDARIVASEAATARILRVLRGGSGQFILTSTDGSMSARIRLAVSDAATSEHDLGSAHVVVDWGRATIANGDRRIVVSRTELRLLGALLAANGESVSRRELIASVWPGDALPPAERENALAVYVCSLRKRLRTVGAGDGLATVRGIGYRAVM